MNTSKHAFTLVELLVTITVIMIVAGFLLNYNFGTIGDKNTLETFTNKIIGELETVRTNSLVGRGVQVSDGSTEQIVPDYWEISFSKSGNIITNYYLNGSISEPAYNTITFPEGYIMNTLTCSNNQGGDNNCIIIFEGNKYYINDKTSPITVLEFEVTYRGYEDLIRFNSLSGLIERIKKD